jgi:hypothetical protein
VVIEAGIGFAFPALVIGYLPVLYQSFSRREVSITLLDARAGSPPSAEELLRGSWSDPEELIVLLREWERWSSAALLSIRHRTGFRRPSSPGSAPDSPPRV